MSHLDQSRGSENSIENLHEATTALFEYFDKQLIPFIHLHIQDTARRNFYLSRVNGIRSGLISGGINLQKARTETTELNKILAGDIVIPAPFDATSTSGQTQASSNLVASAERKLSQEDVFIQYLDQEVGPFVRQNISNKGSREFYLGRIGNISSRLAANRITLPQARSEITGLIQTAGLQIAIPGSFEGAAEKQKNDISIKAKPYFDEKYKAGSIVDITYDRTDGDVAVLHVMLTGNKKVEWHLIQFPDRLEILEVGSGNRTGAKTILSLSSNANMSPETIKKVRSWLTKEGYYASGVQQVAATVRSRTNEIIQEEPIYGIDGYVPDRIAINPDQGSDNMKKITIFLSQQKSKNEARRSVECNAVFDDTHIVLYKNGTALCNINRGDIIDKNRRKDDKFILESIYAVLRGEAFAPGFIPESSIKRIQQVLVARLFPLATDYKGKDLE